MQKPTKKTLIYAAIVIVVAVVVIAALIPDRVIVDVATVERGPMQVTVDEKGETRSRDRFAVTAPVAGELRRIELREGVEVRSGEVIAVIEPLPLDPRQRQELTAGVEAARSALSEARAMADRATSALALARSERKRAEALESEGIMSSETLERARTTEAAAEDDLEAARDRVRAAQAELEAARAGLIATDKSGGDREVEVRAPVDGKVLTIPDRSSRVVQPGQLLLEISDANDLEVAIEMLSTEAVRVSSGDPVIIEDWGGDEPLSGTVRLVEPSGFTKVSALGIEEQRVNVIVDLSGAPASLGDGYRVEARVVVWEGEEILQVPISALFRTGAAWAVFVVDDGTAVIRQVEIGHQTDTTAEVASGLEEGEIVILHPSNELSDGARVEATE